MTVPTYVHRLIGLREGVPTAWLGGAVTKKEIVKELSERYRLSQVDTKLVVQGTFDAIMDAIVQHGRIELRNFGVFEVKQRAARKARNPRTGEEVYVPPKKVVVFKPGRLMEERVAQAPVPGEPSKAPAGAGDGGSADVSSAS